MIPNRSHISISDNEEKIRDFIKEIIIGPRINIQKWSSITNQTPNLKMGYPGQHLASLITGMQGIGTGARGDDIVDGSEVKSCNRIDQVDKCKNCNSLVLRTQIICTNCQSTRIQRNNDSKWLLSVKSEEELNIYRAVPRMIFILTDYPNFNLNDFLTLRIQAFEIWPSSPRHSNFMRLLEGYYRNIYLIHRERNPNKTPAPKNFWPESFQFYMCNPIKTFEAIISNEQNITINKYIPPEVERTTLQSEDMPKSILYSNEVNILNSHGYNIAMTDFINEEMRLNLELRDTDSPITIGTTHVRRSMR
ncbi:MAG: MamI family restriction endonuclease [Neisseriaceae bacterium]|nr:MAG: MamI family restriction endonuclease [Neisseriaceae bacterium]